MSSFAKIAGLLATATLLVACTATKSKVSVDYYQISGNSTAALDRDIRRKGPILGSGKHAIAVARIKMTPKVSYAQRGRQCSVDKAKVHVNARVTLPEWKGRIRASAKLGKAWDNVDRYARQHEAVHVAIAFKYARLMETEMVNQQPEASCRSMQIKSGQLFEKLLELHDREQKQFDADEQKRIARSIKRQSKKS